MLLLFLILFEVQSHIGIQGSRIQNAFSTIQNNLPSFEDLFGLNNADGSISYQVFGCNIKYNKDKGCIKKFTPDQSCFEKLSLTNVFGILWKDNKLETTTKSTFSPGVFAVKEFVLNTCEKPKKNVQFIGELVKPHVINVISDKIQIMSGELTFKFDYNLKQKFNFASIEFTIKGKIKIGNQIIDVEVKKDKESSSSFLHMVAKQIKVMDFSKFFLKTREDGGFFSQMLIENSEIKIVRGEDNSYEVFVSGKASGIAGLGEINALLVVQKPKTGTVQVGVAASLKKVKPLEVISAVIRKNINDIKILKDLELDLSIEYASNDIGDFKNDEIKNQISTLIPNHSKKLLKGTIISLNIPVTEIIKKIGSPANLNRIPPNMLFQVSVKDDIISFTFPKNIFNDGIKILSTLAPVAFNFLSQYIFQSNFEILFEKYDVNFKTKEVEVSISIPGKLSIGDNFLVVENTAVTLKYENSANPAKQNEKQKEFSFSLEAQMKLGSSSFNIKAVKNKNNINFAGSVESLNFVDLANFFGMNGLFAYIPDFSFVIKNFNINAEFGDERKLIITGEPRLFDWENIQFEFIKKKKETNELVNGFLASNHGVLSTNQSILPVDNDNEDDLDGYAHENSNVKSISLNKLFTKRQITEKQEHNQALNKEKQIQKKGDVTSNVDATVFAILMKNINFERFIRMMLKKESTSTNWITLDISLVYSNAKISENPFTNKEIKEAVTEVSQGLVFHGKMMLPESEKGCLNPRNNEYDELCRFAVEKLGAGSSLSVKAGYADKKFFFEASFNGKIKLNKVVINSIVIGVEVELSLKLYICGKLTLKIDKKDVQFNAFISLDTTGKLQLEGGMKGKVNNVLGIKHFALSDLSVGISLQLPFALTGFKFSGMVELGSGNHIIKIQIAFGIEIGKNNYFYGSVSKLTLRKISRAFGYKLSTSIPKNVLDSGVSKLVVAFSTVKQEIEFAGKKIEINKGLRLAGNINILGFTANLDIQISKERFFIYCRISAVSFAGGVLSLTKGIRDKIHGPKICIDISSGSKQIYIEGAVTIFGVSQGIKIDISNRKMEFTITGELFKMQAKLSVTSIYAQNFKDSSFQVSSCLSSVNSATDEANNILKDAAEKTEEIVEATKNVNKKYSQLYEELVSSKELLSNVGKKLFEKMTITFNKIEQYQSKIENSCTLQCQNEVGYFSKNWCSSNCLLDKGERSVRVEASKKKQEDRTMFWGVFEKLTKAFVELVKDGASRLFNGVMGYINRFLDIEIGGKKISDIVQTGLDLVKKGAEYLKDKALDAIKKVITIHVVCFKASLDSKFTGELSFNTNVTFWGKNYAYDIQGRLDFGFVKMIADKITEILSPGIQYIGSALQAVRDKIAGTFRSFKKLSDDKFLNENEVKKLMEDVDKDDAAEEILNDETSDEFTTKNNINRNITIDEIKVQIYNERHVVSLTDGDVLDALNINPDYTLEINYAKNESVDMSDLTHQMVSEKNSCKLAQGLVRNYEKISDELNEVMTFLDNQKELHKKQCLDENHKFNSLEKTAIEKCKRAKCNENQREKLVHLAHSLSHAHVMRTERLDEAFEAIGKRLIKNEREMMTRNIKSSGMNMKRFLSKLKHSTKSASLLPSSTNEYRLRLNASYKAVRDLLQSDQPYQDVVQSFQSMKSNLAFLRENIPCAA